MSSSQTKGNNEEYKVNACEYNIRDELPVGPLAHAQVGSDGIGVGIAVCALLGRCNVEYTRLRKSHALIGRISLDVGVRIVIIFGCFLEIVGNDHI